MKHIAFGEFKHSPDDWGGHDEDVTKYVHFIGVIDSSYTLCGAAWDDAGGRLAVEKKVNCPQCIEIVRSCKSIRANEYVTTK